MGEGVCVRLQAEVCMDCAQGFPLVVLPNKAAINSKQLINNFIGHLYSGLKSAKLECPIRRLHR